MCKGAQNFFEAVIINRENFGDIAYYIHKNLNSKVYICNIRGSLRGSLKGSLRGSIRET